jgi:MFS family permease
MDRFGARRPLIIGPTLTAVGFALLSVRAAPYPAVLLAMTVLGFGMAITVAPLTTSVLNAVPEHRTGVASGINNAVASVGSLLMIALLGTLALGMFERALTRQLAVARAPPQLAQVVESAAGGLVMPAMPATLSQPEQQRARALVSAALEDTVALTLRIAAALALASALVAAVTLAPRAALTAAGKPLHPS